MHFHMQKLLISLFLSTTNLIWCSMPVLLFGLFGLNDLLVDVAIDKQPPETGLATPLNLASYHHGLCHFAFSTIQHCSFKLIGLMVNRSLVLACKGEKTLRWMM